MTRCKSTSRRKRCAGAILLAWLLCACQQPPPDSEAAVVASVVVETVTAQSFSETLETWGSLTPAPGKTRIVAVAAEVEVVEIMVEPGQTVAAEQPLLRVRATSTAALELTNAQNAARFAQQAFARVQKLFGQHLAVNADVDQARQTLAAAQANLASVRVRVGQPGIQELRADAAGMVASVDASVGAILAPGSPLAHLSDSTRLQARLGIEPNELGRLQVGQKVSLETGRDERDAEVGHITDVIAQIDPATHAAAALVALDGPSRLLPGAVVHARVELAVRSGVLTVPHRAVLYDGEQAFLFTLKNGVAHRVEVTVGQDNGERIEIETGLAAGDEVVVDGNYVLADGMTASVASATTEPATP